MVDASVSVQNLNPANYKEGIVKETWREFQANRNVSKLYWAQFSWLGHSCFLAWLDRLLSSMLRTVFYVTYIVCVYVCDKNRVAGGS